MPDNDVMLELFSDFLLERKGFTFPDAGTWDGSPLACFFWDQARICVQIKDGQLMIGEVPLSLPPWAVEFQRRLADSCLYWDATGEQCLRLLDKVLGDLEADAEPDPLQPELGGGD